MQDDLWHAEGYMARTIGKCEKCGLDREEGLRGQKHRGFWKGLIIRHDRQRVGDNWVQTWWAGSPSPLYDVFNILLVPLRWLNPFWILSSLPSPFVSNAIHGESDRSSPVFSSKKGLSAIKSSCTCMPISIQMSDSKYQQCAILQGPQDAISSIAFSPNSHFVAAAGELTWCHLRFTRKDTVYPYGRCLLTL